MSSVWTVVVVEALPDSQLLVEINVVSVGEQLVELILVGSASGDVGERSPRKPVPPKRSPVNPRALAGRNGTRDGWGHSSSRHGTI